MIGRFLPPLAIGLFALVVGAVALSAGDTFGFDFAAYHGAGRRILDGQPLYQLGAEFAGGAGLFLYPPPFAVAMVPFGLLPLQAASVVWFGVLLAAFFGAVALLPVRTTVKWAVILLAGQAWPTAYGFKLGQVGPLLLLAFAIGWRWMDNPGRLGASGAAGALVKLQPGLTLVWAALTGRWRAAAIGVAIGVAACLVATVIVGLGAWVDYVSLLRQVSDPISTPHNFTPGAVAYQLGLPRGLATAIQLMSIAAAIAAVLVAVRWATAEASFLAAVVASQLLSPLLWDHYAIVLTLPIAWLLHRGQWWAVLVPLATSIVLVAFTPGWVYPFVFWVVMAGVLWVGIRERARA